MTRLSLSEEQKAKLLEALEIAKLAEDKAREMSELATAIAQKSQKHLYEMARLASHKSN
ncbi:hypothetical protein [Hydrococcus rivularis]|uniref:hypothetical protein n=1 Tax=Hydrococcus rivularis TaxID=1616834 RepID=UPI000B0E15D9|nr:hypothetical protein [Hydrococcus rivularis]